MKQSNILTLLSILFLFSCKSGNSIEEKQQELKSELSDKIMHYIKSVNTDSTFVLDSIKIYKVDTLNQKADSIDAYFALVDKFDEYKAEIDPIGQQVKNDIQLMRLSNGLSSNLYENYKDDYEKHIAEYKAINEMMQLVFSRMEKLRLLTESKTLDSARSTGYKAKFNVKAHNTSGVSEDRDSLQIHFDMEKRIVKKK